MSTLFYGSQNEIAFVDACLTLATAYRDWVELQEEIYKDRVEGKHGQDN